jgi:hypothetical protein
LLHRDGPPRLGTEMAFTRCGSEFCDAPERGTDTSVSAGQRMRQCRNPKPSGPK